MIIRQEDSANSSWDILLWSAPEMKCLFILIFSSYSTFQNFDQNPSRCGPFNFVLGNIFASKANIRDENSILVTRAQ